MASPLYRLPQELLDNVAFHLALAHPHGPPCPILPLLLTSRHLYHRLAIDRNPHLYARIFGAVFDYKASARRLCEEASYATPLASQLVRYARTLINIKRADLHSPTLLNDLCNLFVLCLEDDGSNACLLQWAHTLQFIQRYITNLLWAHRQHSQDWPLESHENSLALWIYFFSLDYESLAALSEQDRTRILFLISPFAFYNFRYPPFLVPDNHVHLPLSGHLSVYEEHSSITPHGYYPPYRLPDRIKLSFEHYGRPLAIAEPPIGLISKLLYIAFAESYPIVIPEPSEAPVPVDRAEADALQVTGPTLADYGEFALQKAVYFPRLGQDHSARHDNDWERWRGCLNPWDDTRTRAPVFTPGSLSGLWSGQYLSTDIHNYYLAMDSHSLQHPQRHSSEPLFFRLREHHCVSPAVPIPHTEVLQSDPLNEGLTNAYFPRAFPGNFVGLPADIRPDGVLKIRERGNPQEYVYETYVEGRPNSHDEATCDICRYAAESECEHEEEDETEREGSSRVPPSDGEFDDDDESDNESDDDEEDALEEEEDGADDSASCLSDTASDGGTEIFNTCSGIRDIIITGETLPHHARAWGDFRIYGRVRAWDGLVVLVREPVWPGPDPAPYDKYIFRGYLVGGRNLVGSWRHVTGSVHSIPVEGPFVVSKVEEEGAGARAAGAGAGVSESEAGAGAGDAHAEV